MSLLLNLLFETYSYSNEDLLAKFGFDTAENKPCELRDCQVGNTGTNKLRIGIPVVLSPVYRYEIYR